MDTSARAEGTLHRSRGQRQRLDRTPAAAQVGGARGVLDAGPWL